MSRISTVVAIVAAVTLAGIALSQDKSGAKNSDLKPPPGLNKLPLGLIAKSQSNPVFQAARVGALDAAKEWTEKLGIPVTVDWRTPTDENAQKQAEFLDQLVNQ